jgi:hypothetical protein
MLEVLLFTAIPTMPPYVLSAERVPVEPMRLVLIQHRCFYCGNPDDVHLYRLWHLFGILHCSQHAVDAKEDCEEFLRTRGFVRRCDAMAHPVLGPFMESLGTNIPVLRSSGTVETGWYFPLLDEVPLIRKSTTFGCWGFHLCGGESEKFVPLTQFRDPRVFALLKEETQEMLGAVETAFVAGFY